MGIFTAIEAGVEAVGTAVSIIGRSEAASAKEKAVDLELKQEQLAEDQRSTQRTARLNDVLANQTAEAGAKGFSAASGSLFAIGADSINKFAQDENADAINLSFDKINAANKKSNIKANELWGDAGSVIDLGANLYGGSFSKGISKGATQAEEARGVVDDSKESAGVSGDSFGEPL